jgi:cytochrome c biogenesis protein CcmG/thiol:disulfide interchange protein DsbE
VRALPRGTCRTDAHGPGGRRAAHGHQLQGQAEDALRWLNNLGNPYERVGTDLDGRAGIEWGISGVPESFIVDGSGTVLYRYVGPVVGDDAVGKFSTALAQARANAGAGS